MQYMNIIYLVKDVSLTLGNTISKQWDHVPKQSITHNLYIVRFYKTLRNFEGSAIQDKCTSVMFYIFLWLVSHILSFLKIVQNSRNTIIMFKFGFDQVFGCGTIFKSCWKAKQRCQQSPLNPVHVHCGSNKFFCEIQPVPLRT